MVGDTVRLLRQAWTGELFEYQGRTIVIRPVPYRRSTLFLGGVSEAAARRAARIADDFYTPHDEALWAPFRDECIKQGRPDPGPAKPLGPVFLWVAENTDDVWTMLMPHTLSQFTEYEQFMTEGYGEAALGPYRSKPSPEEVRQNPANQALTPEETIALAERLGSRGVLQLNPWMDVIAPQEAWKMMRLFEDQGPALPSVSNLPSVRSEHSRWSLHV